MPAWEKGLLRGSPSPAFCAAFPLNSGATSQNSRAVSRHGAAPCGNARISASAHGSRLAPHTSENDVSNLESSGVEMSSHRVLASLLAFAAAGLLIASCGEPPLP